MDENNSQNKKLGETELKDVSGGGSGLAVCIFETLGYEIGDMDAPARAKNGPPRKSGDGYVAYCGQKENPILCNPVTCRCWGTSHCSGGYHKCGENGKAFGWHGLTI